MPTITHGSATFDTRVLDPLIAIVSVNGELDITNVTHFVDTAALVAEGRSSVVIDLSGVQFFGTAGFSALHILNQRYTARQTPWAVVPSRNVNRVVGICDTDAFVPLRATLAMALESM